MDVVVAARAERALDNGLVQAAVPVCVLHSLGWHVGHSYVIFAVKQLMWSVDRSWLACPAQAAAFQVGAIAPARTSAPSRPARVRIFSARDSVNGPFLSVVPFRWSVTDRGPGGNAGGPFFFDQSPLRGRPPG